MPGIDWGLPGAWRIVWRTDMNVAKAKGVAGVAMDP